MSISTIIQPLVVVRPLVLARKTTLKKAHDPSRAWSRIAIPRFQVPIEGRPGAVGASRVVSRKPCPTELIADSCCHPLLDARALDLLEEFGQFVRRRTVLVESRISERLTQKNFRYLTTIVLLRERQNRRGPGKALFHIVAARCRTWEPW